MTKTHYETLEVRDAASIETIKGAYKHLTQKWHPDKNPDQLNVATQKTAHLNEAYATLSDTKKRAAYDAKLGVQPQPDDSTSSGEDDLSEEQFDGPPLTPSAALSVIVGTKPLPRAEVVSKIWAYIKRHNLQDGVNERMIHADAKLLAIFIKPQISMFEMAGLLSKHLK